MSLGIVFMVTYVYFCSVQVFTACLLRATRVLAARDQRGPKPMRSLLSGSRESRGDAGRCADYQRREPILTNETQAL